MYFLLVICAMALCALCFISIDVEANNLESAPIIAGWSLSFNFSIVCKTMFVSVSLSNFSSISVPASFLK